MLRDAREPTMRRSYGAAVLAACLITPTLICANDLWQPAKAPLMTPWAERLRPDGVHPEYPRPHLVRGRWLNLNGLWQYAVTPKGEEPDQFQGSILVPFPIESALSGVMRRVEPTQQLWYRKMLRIPRDWNGQRLLLHFGGVDWETQVYVNGKVVGTHRGGYDPFTLDITDAVRADQEEQELIVAVWDPTDTGTQPRGKQVSRPGGIYYTPSTGIWQTVWLEPVPQRYIAGVRIVADYDTRTVSVTVQVEDGQAPGGPGGESEAQARPSARVRVSLTDQPVFEGKPVLERMGRILAQAEGSVGQPVSVQVPTGHFQPWSPEHPRLYGLHVELLAGPDAPADAVASYCGFRKIEVAKDSQGTPRLFLNGQPYFQLGLLDQGFWPDGLYTASSDEALRYDLEMTKKLGFNMCRKHVKVEPARWYHWCDRLGLLVWQDMPSGDRSVPAGRGEITRSPESAQQFERELQRMLESLHHFPCIVMWVVFNEGWGQYDTVRLTRWVKQADPTRLVNGASGWNDMQVGDVHDIHAYPGPAAPPREEKRAGVLGEFGGLGLGVDGHTWARQTWGYRGTASRDDLTRKYERLLARVWQLQKEAGLSAAVYTQTTDVETEANGLLTYDRKVVKVDLQRVAAINRGDLSKLPVVKLVVPASQEQGQTWRYTFHRPAEGWHRPGFDASSWQEGPGGFGTRGTPGSVVRTLWNTPAIWLRREFQLADEPNEQLHLLVHHDEDAEIYLNGILAARLTGYVTDYEEVPILPEARAALKKGRNLLAVHCRQTAGGQYIDVGLVQVIPPAADKGH
jgi:hypothetical protein